MAEHKRNLGRVRDRENKPVSLSTKAVLFHAWTYVPTDEARAYYAGQRGRPRVMLHRGLAGMAADLEISIKQLRRHLQALDDAHVMMWPGGDWFELISKEEQETLLRHLDPEPRTAVNTSEPQDRDTSVPSRRDTSVPKQGHMCPDSGTHLSEDRDTCVPRSLVGSDRDQIGIGSGSRTRARPDRSASFREIALEIVSLAPTPIGCASLPPTADGIRDLVALLEGGWSRESIVAVLQAAPGVVRARPDKARFYSPEMFRGERWSVWRNDVAQLAVAPLASNDPRSEAVAAATGRDEAEVQAEADRKLCDEIVAAIRRPPTPNEFERMFWHGLPRWRAALLFAPREAQRAGLAVLRAAEAERRQVEVIELTRVLNAVQFDDPTRPASDEGESGDDDGEPDEDVLAELQALREQAAREGRRPTWDELASVGRGGRP